MTDIIATVKQQHAVKDDLIKQFGFLGNTESCIAASRCTNEPLVVNIIVVIINRDRNSKMH